MTMPRPSGKALRIAEQTIPGLYRNLNKKRRKQNKPKIPQDTLEIKVTEINENKGIG